MTPLNQIPYREQILRCAEILKVPVQKVFIEVQTETQLKGFYLNSRGRQIDWTIDALQYRSKLYNPFPACIESPAQAGCPVKGPGAARGIAFPAAVTTRNVRAAEAGENDKSMDHKKEPSEDTPDRSPVWYKLRRAEKLRGEYPSKRKLGWALVVLTALGVVTIVAFWLLNRR